MLIKMDLLSPLWPSARANVLLRPFPDTYSVLYSYVSLCLGLTLTRAYIVLPSDVNLLMSSLTNTVMAFHFHIWCTERGCLLELRPTPLKENGSYPQRYRSADNTANALLCETSLWEFLIKSLNGMYHRKQDIPSLFEMV